MRRGQEQGPGSPPASQALGLLLGGRHGSALPENRERTPGTVVRRGKSDEIAIKIVRRPSQSSGTPRSNQLTRLILEEWSAIGQLGVSGLVEHMEPARPSMSSGVYSGTS